MTEQILMEKMQKVTQAILAQKQIASTTKSSEVLNSVYDTVRVLQEVRQEYEYQFNQIHAQQKDNGPEYSDLSAQFK